MFQIRAAGKSDIGKKRTNNQDSILVNEAAGLFAVADGMGGHSGGEVASSIAVRTLDKVFAEARQLPVAQRMAEAVKFCNRAIFQQASENPKLQGMGTTLTAAAIDGPWLQIAQVGDSRCYLYRHSQLFQITEDHSQVYELLKAGLITEQNLDQFQRNVITRSVGYELNVQIDLFARRLESGDRYVICSDGLSGMVNNLQIAQVLQNHSIEEAVVNLVDLANLNGGEDNVSVIVFEVV